MIITLDLEGEIPLYQQIRDRVVEGIADGSLRAGDALPSTRQLGSDLGINFHTVNKGYDVLRTEGLVRLNRKSGAVIARDPGSGPPAQSYTDGWETRARTLLAEAVAQGLTPDEILDRCGAILAGFEPDTPSERTRKEER